MLHGAKEVGHRGVRLLFFQRSNNSTGQNAGMGSDYARGRHCGHQRLFIGLWTRFQDALDGQALRTDSQLATDYELL